MNKTISVLMGITCVAAAVLCSGCGTTAGVRTTRAPLESVENLVYLDAVAARQIPCESLQAERLASGRTRVIGRFYNKRNNTAECQIKVKFKNAAGDVVDETGWMPFLLPRREVVQFDHTSLSTDVKDFTLMLRAAK
jgi:hypothetical protein